jgi:energy-coupling factor transport system ATP-binding protein
VVRGGGRARRRASTRRTHRGEGGRTLTAPALSHRDVRFRYRGRREHALDRLDLDILPGEFVGVVGPSGAGKSTFCFTTNGLIPHFVKGRAEGEVRVFGELSSDSSVAEIARHVGLVFQDFEAQLFSTNVELEVAFGLENFAVPVEEIRRRVDEVLEIVDLKGLERREPATLSGGQKQRLAIASVLALEPRILVMDEPTTDLDPIGKEEVFAVSRRLRAEGATLVVVEHETEEILDVDRILVLADGSVAAIGPPDEIMTRSDWLEEIGVQPPGAAHLLTALGEDPVLDHDDAAGRLLTRGFAVPDERWDDLLAVDGQRAQQYGEPLIEVRDLEHRYPNGVVALTGADITIRTGEFIAIIGSNGSGKTTLVKHMNGLLLPTTGAVRVDGRLTTETTVKDLGLQVGYVFQNPDHQIFAETVSEEVAFGPRNHGVAEEEISLRVAEAIEAVGLVGREDEDPFAMTKGERQRVAVASVLATRPQVIVLDEPTTGLDYREQRLMMDLVRRLNAAGHTIICVTHAMWVVAEYAHRVAVMADGRIIADDTTRAIFAREEDLKRANLKPPQVVRVTNRLGRTLLTVEEARQALRKG